MIDCSATIRRGSFVLEADCASAAPAFSVRQAAGKPASYMHGADSSVRRKDIYQ